MAGSDRIRPLLIIAAVALAACSLGRSDRDDCTNNDECAAAFGVGSTCSDGFCLDPAVAPAVVDECAVDSVPVRVSSNDEFTVDTSDFADDLRELSSCTGSNADGNDAFFAIDMVAGEKWHFHVGVPEGDDLINPSVYVLENCDARTCQLGDAIDECEDGSDEHLTFVAPDTGRYIIGVDSRSSGGARYDMLAVAPECGDGGSPDHSETCDDNNTESGDGCDALCRHELSDSETTEREPNDDFTGANVVLFGADTGQLTISGQLGGRCDYDMFALDVPDGGTIEARMLNSAGDPCNGAVPSELRLSLIDTDGLLERGVGASNMMNDCPVIGANAGFAQDLSAGTYYVRVTSGEGLDSMLSYRIHLTVSAP